MHDLLLGRWPTREPPTRPPATSTRQPHRNAPGGLRSRIAFTLDNTKYYVDRKFVQDVAAADAALAEMNRGPRGSQAGTNDALRTPPQGKSSKIKCHHCQHVQAVRQASRRLYARSAERD